MIILLNLGRALMVAWIAYALLLIAVAAQTDQSGRDPG